MRLIVADILLQTIKQLKLAFPRVSKEQKKNMAELADANRGQGRNG